MWKIGIWEEKIMSAAILVLQWQEENVLEVGKCWNFPTSKLYTMSEKNAISEKVFNRFPKAFLELKDVEKSYLGRKSHERSYFSFAIAKWKLFSSRKIWNFPLSRSTLCQKKCYITKGIQPILKNIPAAERCGK